MQRQGIGVHRGPFLWLVANTVLVGFMVGIERTVVPLLGRDVYHAGAVAALSFIAAFGLAKAPLNLVAGRWSDRAGRRPVLLWGWALALPTAALLILVHAWWAVVAANVLLGANQALTWTMTVTAQMDLAGHRQRGLAMGINEATGYLGVAAAAWGTGYSAGVYGFAAPFDLAAAVAVLGLFSAWGFVQETRSWVQAERPQGRPAEGARLEGGAWPAFLYASFREPSLSAASWAGMANKLADTAAWGALPLWLAAQHVPVPSIGLVSGAYAATWGLCQFRTGLLSDRIGRKPPIVGGFVLLGAALVMLPLVTGMPAWTGLAVLGGPGMALLYPNLNSAVGDLALPDRRGSVLGVYRLWRDGGYCVGGLAVGALVGILGPRATILVIGALAWGMAALLSVRLQETRFLHPGRRPGQVPG